MSVQKYLPEDRGKKGLVTVLKKRTALKMEALFLKSHRFFSGGFPLNIGGIIVINDGHICSINIAVTIHIRVQVT